VLGETLGDSGRGTVEGAIEEPEVETCDIGARESEAVAEPLRASELMLCIFFTIELVASYYNNMHIRNPLGGRKGVTVP